MTEETKLILGRIDEMTQQFQKKVRELELEIEKLKSVDTVQTRAIVNHTQDIRDIYERLTSLETKPGAVKYHRQKCLGLDREAAYSVIEDCGMSPRAALKLLEDLGYLIRDKSGVHRTKVISDNGRRIRVVMIRKD